MTTSTNYRRVQVHFGQHVIIDNVLASERAEWFADKMRQRWGGLRTTVEPITTADLAREVRR